MSVNLRLSARTRSASVAVPSHTATICSAMIVLEQITMDSSLLKTTTSSSSPGWRNTVTSVSPITCSSKSPAFSMCSNSARSTSLATVSVLSPTSAIIANIGVPVSVTESEIENSPCGISNRSSSVTPNSSSICGNAVSKSL